MGIRESALSTLSALTNSDFVRMVSSAGASRKISLQAIAQHIIEQYAGSSLLGRQQSVKSALDELNSTIARENFASLCTWNDNLDAMQAWKVGKTVQLIFRAKSGSTHAENEVIVDIPAGYRPSATVYGMIFLAGGVACIIQISTAGRCVLYTAPSYPTGRFYGNILYTLQ